jgi:hypothetical protein
MPGADLNLFGCSIAASDICTIISDRCRHFGHVHAAAAALFINKEVLVHR